MKITYSQECLALLARLELFSKFIEETCHAPTRMMLTQSKPPQYYAAKWYDNGKIIFVHGIMHKGAGGEFENQELEIHSALELKENLPAGVLNRNMPMREIFLKVVDSFGVPVSCHAEVPLVKLYSGRWDGKMVRCMLDRDEYYQISGDFNVREGYSQDVWVFSFKSYKEWFVNAVNG